MIIDFASYGFFYLQNYKYQINNQTQAILAYLFNYYILSGQHMANLEAKVINLSKDMHIPI